MIGGVGAVAWGFNPRPRMGGDLVMLMFGMVRDVSIHAPAWGATPCQKSDK